MLSILIPRVKGFPPELCLNFLSFSQNFSVCRKSPTRSRAASFSRFVDHTQWHTTLGMTSLGVGSARRRGLYLTTHNTHNIQKCYFTYINISCTLHNCIMPYKHLNFQSFRSIFHISHHFDVSERNRCFMLFGVRREESRNWSVFTRTEDCVR